MAEKKFDVTALGELLIDFTENGLSGPAASLEEIKNFTTALFDAYTEAFQNRRNAMMRMKEFWFFQANLFEENPKAFKNIFKSKTEEDFLAAIEEIEAGRPLTDARFGWKKPL